MNIFTVRKNLQNTIDGKKVLLEKYQELGKNFTERSPSLEMSINFLTVNINELETILKDVNLCVEKAVEDSWRNNPDRMGQ